MTGRVVVVELRGRLGNQLFEWAAGTAIASHHGAALRFVRHPALAPGDVLLPCVVGDHYRAASPRELLHVFRVRPEARFAPSVNRALGAARLPARPPGGVGALHACHDAGHRLL